MNIDIQNGTKNALLGALKTVTDKMIETRPQAEIRLRPYTDCTAVKRNFRTSIEVDFSKLFGGAKDGDTAFAETDLLVPFDTDVNLMAKGIFELYYGGEKVFSANDAAPLSDLHMKNVVLKAKKGKNKLIFKCTKNGRFFGFAFMVTHVFEPYMWANDILLWVRDTSPAAEYENEQGIALSKLYGKDADFDVYINDTEYKFIFPAPSKECKKVDFEKIYPQNIGNTAFALSYAKSDGRLDINLSGRDEIYINGKKSDGKFLKCGDEIIVKCTKSPGGWGFECSEDNLNLPFVCSKRKHGAKWLVIGAFDEKYKISVQFKEPYESLDGEKTFWRFAEDDTYLRPYLDSCFFAQWTYALMVGEYGIFNASKFFKEYFGYFYKSMSVTVDYFDYIRFEKQKFGNTTFMPRAAQLTNLDAIGAAGMMLCELYNCENDKNRKSKILHVIKTLAEKMKKTPQNENGIFYRVKTMWADDTFMSCPFLVRLGRVLNDKSYADEAVRQLTGYKNILFMEDKKLYSHIYFPMQGERNNVAWCRGNGWVFFALCDALENIPPDTIGYDEIKKNFSDFAGGLALVQSDSGMWRQVLDDEDTYKETSGSCLFAIGMLRGARLGFLDKKYAQCAKAAVEDILKNMVDSEGNIEGVCRGSQCSMDKKYYAMLETNRNDDHGTGLVMTALCEYIEYINYENSK